MAVNKKATNIVQSHGGYPMKSFRATKIIATLGPASRSEEGITSLIDAGANLFRLNFAHETRELHAKTISLVKRIAKERGATIGVLADIAGPKIRLGELPDGEAHILPGQFVSLSDRSADPKIWPVQLREFAKYVTVGDPIYLDDGTKRLRVEEVDGAVVRCRVEVGGTVVSRKGMNLPNLRRALPVVSEKDIEDARAAVEAGADWLALSFVSDARDAEPLRHLMREMGVERPLLAKLERPAALENLSAILEAFDGVMVARGDLGMEIDFEKVPAVQTEIIRAAIRAAKPVVVATQMLESMVHSPRPTRAEVTDIAYAIESGADAVMLSEETAVGENPAEAVRVMAKVAVATEVLRLDSGALLDTEHPDIEAAIGAAAARLARDTSARAILCPTTSGAAVRAVAKFRPRVPIVAVSNNAAVVGHLTLLSGVLPFYRPLTQDTDERIHTAEQTAIEEGVVSVGDVIVEVGGYPPGKGNANLVRVRRL
jgi:pyruvate kinase